MELCSILCGGLDGREVWGSMDTCICLIESLCCPYETIIALLTGYTPVQNKKLKKSKTKPLSHTLLQKRKDSVFFS